MLVTARALLRVAAQAIGQALARGPGTQAQPFGEAIVEANGHVDRHAYSVARCQQ